MWWPDDWYLRVATLMLVAFAIHWPVARFIDFKLGFRRVPFFSTVAGTAPLGQAFILIGFFGFFSFPDYVKGAGSHAQLLWQWGTTAVFLGVGVQFCEASERSVRSADAAVHFESTWLSPARRLPFYFPGVFLFRLVWLACLYVFLERDLYQVRGKPDLNVHGLPGFIRYDSTPEDGSPLPDFIPFSRAWKFLQAPVVALIGAVFLGVLWATWRWGFADEPALLAMQAFVGVFCGFIPPVFVYFMVRGGLMITDNGICFPRPLLEPRCYPWQKIREFAISTAFANRLAFELEGPEGYHFLYYGRPRVVVYLPLEGDLEKLVAQLNRELQERRSRSVVADGSLRDG
ncbi:MAG TPA: hypothetical protein DC046_01630 [Rhodospirillaceae bacterium]|nr:hypothetical protein [Rhodospirillaceae bacterium]